MLRIEKSLEYFQRATGTIPSATQTFSKGYTQFSFGVSPLFLSSADGAYVTDVDGNRFLDLPGALGPIILGHNYPSVVSAVEKQLKQGIAFSLPHYREVEVAEKLRSIIPQAEMTRFGKNGSDATAGAVRASRAYTGRDLVACCGYHGWQDWYIGTTTRNKGVPKAVQELTKTFNYNDIGSLEKLFQQYPQQIACVILEPVGLVMPENGFLEKVVELGRKNGAVVIFDECWTGFRLSLSGAQGYFGVKPDVSCFGKAMGNGFPISAICGRKDFMQVFDEIFYSFTFGGDVLGLTAVSAVISELETKPVLKEVHRLGQRLIDGVNALIETHRLGKHLSLKGLPPRTIFSITDEKGAEWLELKSLLQQELHQRQVLFGGYHVITYAYTDPIIDSLLEAYDQSFKIARQAIENESVTKMLRGKVVQPVFRKP